jgi:tellurite resistance protein TehA-like permease
MWSKLTGVIRDGVRDLFPGIFALVMATGIVSIACHLLNFELVAQVLFYFNQAVFVLLWILTLARLAFYSRRLVVDLTDNARGPGFFTLVAGTCVLGSQFVLLNGNRSIALALWCLGLVLWLLVIYAFFTAATVQATKPGLEKGINGTWLIAIVATQSVSILGTLLAKGMNAWVERTLFYTLSMYLLGGMLYILIMTIILYRLLFYRIEPGQMGPTYWISMGAVAISTLAGDTLILNAGEWGFLQELLPFIKGLNLLFWATATFWIPLLVLLGVWRHIFKKFSLRYDPQFWGIVFPLGMYTVSTFQLAKALDLPFLFIIPRLSVYISLLAWLAVMAELIHRLVKNVFLALRDSPSP